MIYEFALQLFQDTFVVVQDIDDPVDGSLLVFGDVIELEQVLKRGLEIIRNSELCHEFVGLLKLEEHFNKQTNKTN